MRTDPAPLSAPPQRTGSRQFISAKTTGPVPVPSTLARRALIRLTLDPDIDRIAPPEIPEALATVTDTAGQTATILISDSGDPPATIGGRVIALTEADILAEPRASNTVLVWACRSRWIPPGDQVRIARHLAEFGASPIIDVAQVATASTDGVATVLALACCGLLDLDLSSGPLSPETRVFRRQTG